MKRGGGGGGAGTWAGMCPAAAAEEAAAAPLCSPRQGPGRLATLEGTSARSEWMTGGSTSTGGRGLFQGEGEACTPPSLNLDTLLLPAQPASAFHLPASSSRRAQSSFCRSLWACKDWQSYLHGPGFDPSCFWEGERGGILTLFAFDVACLSCYYQNHFMFQCFKSWIFLDIKSHSFQEY